MTMTKEMKKMTTIDEKRAHIEHTFTTPIDGEAVEYTRHQFFQEVESKATYRSDKKGYLVEDNDTWRAAFKKLAELRGVTPDVAYHWLHDIAAEMLEYYQTPLDQGGFPDLAIVYECDGPIYLMNRVDRMVSLLNIVLSNDD